MTFVSGMRVKITWSGGNGPHVYGVTKDDRGNLWFSALECPVEPVDSPESRAAKIEVID